MKDQELPKEVKKTLEEISNKIEELLRIQTKPLESPTPQIGEVWSNTQSNEYYLLLNYDGIPGWLYLGQGVDNFSFKLFLSMFSTQLHLQNFEKVSDSLSNFLNFWSEIK